MSNELTIKQEISTESLQAIEAIIRRVVDERQTSQLEAQLLSPAQACKLFSPAVSTKTLTRWANDGSIPEYRIGGRIYYRCSEVIAAAKQLKRYKRG